MRYVAVFAHRNNRLSISRTLSKLETSFIASGSRKKTSKFSQIWLWKSSTSELHGMWNLSWKQTRCEDCRRDEKHAEWPPQQTWYTAHGLQCGRTGRCLVAAFTAAHINHLTSYDHYMGRTAQLTSRCCILYRVSQEECARLREGVPYVKVFRYNPKHLCPKLNGYGDNGQRKVWSSGGSTHCTCQLATLSMFVLECGFILWQFSSRSLQTVYVLTSWW